MKEDSVQSIVSESKYLVALCGSGMLKESGKLSMRDQQRAYDIEQVYGYSPEEMFTSAFYNTRPEQFYKFFREEIIAGSDTPGDGFFYLAKLQKNGKLKCVITNNVYSFPQKAGCENVIELHGSVENNFCPHCGATYTKEFILSSQHVPHCVNCGAQIRPGLVFFGEMVDNSVMTKASTEIAKADTLLLLGATMHSELIQRYINHFQGDHLVLVNPTEDYMDSKADLVIHESVTDILKQITDSLE